MNESHSDRELKKVLSDINFCDRKYVLELKLIPYEIAFRFNNFSKIRDLVCDGKNQTQFDKAWRSKNFNTKLMSDVHKMKLKLTLIEEIVKYLPIDFPHIDVDMVKKIGCIHGIVETTRFRNQVVKSVI